MSDAIREAFEALEWLLKSSNLPDRAAKYNKVKSALQSSQTAPAVPEGWRTAKDGEHWPHIGGKYLIKLNGVLQHEIYEFDQADDGCGGGEYFWDREDLDEAAPFDPEKDEWLPIDQAGMRCSDHSPDAGRGHIPLAALDTAYCLGWTKASQWAECEDLISDMDSPAFSEEKSASLDYVCKKYAMPATDAGKVVQGEG